MQTLRDIFFHQLTLGCDKWEPYFDVYENYFRKFVGKSPVIVEVGVQSGGSLQMWRQYFGAGAQIWGIDIDPNVATLQHHYDADTHLVIGDQGSPQFWETLLQRVPQIDIFIDDGGHLSHQQRTTFECVFPHIKTGGVFLCEDTHASYMPWLGGARNNPNTFIEYSKRLVDLLHRQFFEQQQAADQVLLPLVAQLEAVHFYNSIVVFLKNQLPEFKRVLVNK